MPNINNFEYLLKDISFIKGIGSKTTSIFNKKKIFTILDLLWKLPYSIDDLSQIKKISELHIGKVESIKVNVIKYNFPRKRNLPNRVICEDETGKIECVFFNSYEGYIKKILPLNNNVTISGKVSYFRNTYQITNPSHVSHDESLILKKHNKYSLTDGLNNKAYNKIMQQVLKNVPDLEEWHDPEVLKKFNNISWKKSILKLHDPKSSNKKNSKFFKRLAFDEIFSTFLISSRIRDKIKKVKKEKKLFDLRNQKNIEKNINFTLTNEQNDALHDINNDLKNKDKMFRLLQGDVGSGKTIVALLSALNVINSGYQVCFMAPTEILARQHYNLAKSIFPKNQQLFLLTGTTDSKDKKKIINEIKNKKNNIVFGTHALFQKKIIFKKLGYIVIDEQHKFGVKQRKKLSDKGGKNCDILLMSATPIPRTLIMSIYGDMDVSLIKKKPNSRLPIVTYSKLDQKMDEVIQYVKKEINLNNQVFWVCPLIDESKKVDQVSAIQKYNFLKKKFPNDVELLHSKVDVLEKEIILKKFLNKEFKILVSTTVIEVGIDFPNANLIIIENANKFGLSQLHQLRGRVGRGTKQGVCILIFKSGLSENAKKRIKILKKTNDGFEISEEDMKLRGYGDVLGFKQSGVKNFRLADPIINKDLFDLAENEIKKVEQSNFSSDRYKYLLKLYDRADIINDII
ncbi:ATP-dependent DNA helicase RecG [Pelagibacterales bacterium SAG-MED15]|nr:ATP-dependent DNA helicase RecG [Pelagibacterales bacterium SAG-MED15]